MANRKSNDRPQASKGSASASRRAAGALSPPAGTASASRITSPTAVGAPPADLPSNPRYIVAIGQSNTAAVPPTIGASWLQGFLGADLLGWDEGNSVWAPLLDNGANVPASNGQTGGGMILTPLMRAIADRSGDVRLIAGAFSGLGIASFLSDSATKYWYGSPGASSQHATLNNHDVMRNRVQSSNADIELVIIIQGEADTGASEASYKASLNQWIDEYRLFCPRAHFIIVGTVGDATYNGVRAAQQAVCAERYYCHYLDNSDMYGHTAWWASDGTAHYSTFAGYEEVYLRLDAMLLGLPNRANVAAVNHIDGVIAWQRSFQYRHSAASGQVVAWQDDAPSGLSPISATGVGAACPGHIPNDPQFPGLGGTGRPSVDFERSNSETLVATLTTVANAGKWTIHAVGRLESIVQTMRLCEIRNIGAADRISPTLVGQFNAAAMLVAGVNTVFSGGTMGIDVDYYHDWCFVYDAPNLVARYYVDGARVAEVAVANTEDMTPTPTLNIGSLGTQDYLDGHLTCLRVACGIAANDAQALAMSQWVAVEFGSDV